MQTVTLKLPEPLANALQTASRRRGVSRSALIREALEHALAAEVQTAGPAAQWLSQWRGALRTPTPDAGDERLQQIFDKHLR